jgi:hypothetical protein
VGAVNLVNLREAARDPERAAQPATLAMALA